MTLTANDFHENAATQLELHKAEALRALDMHGAACKSRVAAIARQHNIDINPRDAEKMFQELKDQIISEVTVEVTAMLEGLIFDQLADALEDIPMAQDVIEAAKDGEGRGQLLEAVQSVYGPDLMVALAEMSALMEGDPTTNPRVAEALAKLQDGLSVVVVQLIQEFMEGQLCDKLVELCGADNPGVVASLEAVMAYVPREEIANLNRYICEAASGALGKTEINAQQLATRLMNGDITQAEQNSMVAAASALVEKLGWEYTEKGIYYMLDSIVGETAMASIGCRDCKVPGDMKEVAITVLEEVVGGENDSILMTLHDIQSGNITPAVRAELTTKLHEAVMASAQNAALGALKAFCEDDPWTVPRG